MLEKNKIKILTFHVDKYYIPPITNGFSLFIINDMLEEGKEEKEILKAASEVEFQPMAFQ